MATLKLEVGKFYRDASGEKRGPAWNDQKPGAFPWLVPSKMGNHWYGNDAKSCIGADYDLIAEWTDAPTGPVRTVTRKEIVPGVYGAFWIGETWGDETRATVGMSNSKDDTMHALSADELRQAAAHFIAVADALEEQA